MAVKDKEASISPALSRDELMAVSRELLKVSPEALAGALHGSNQSEWTLDQARSLVDKFLKRKVN